MSKRVYVKDVNQRINNFYSLATIVMMSAVIAIYVQYIQPKIDEKKEFKKIVLPCQNSFRIFHSIGEQDSLKEGFELFSRGDYIIDGGTILNDNTSFSEQEILKNIDRLLENSIEVVSIQNVQKFLRVKYEFIENEQKEKLPYLALSFRVAKNEVFKAKTRVDLKNQKESQEKIACIMEVFKTNAKQ